MFLKARIRERVSGMMVSIFIGICMLGMGALLTFVISPQQALEWRKVQRLPELTPQSLASTAAGEDVVFTGTLENNPAFGHDLVIYEEAVWVVEPPQDSEDSPSGSWQVSTREYPALTVNFQGSTVQTLAAPEARLSGNYREFITPGSGQYSDDYEGQELPDGSERMRGFANGDLVTIYGQKSSTGDVIPAQVFGGDRVQLVEHIRSGARAAFAGGIAMMACAPLAVGIGVVSSILGKRK